MRTQQQENSRDLLFSGARISFLVVVGVIFLGGLSDWAYLNVQEYPIQLPAAFVEYLASYASAFLIAGIEISAAYYFVRKYELGKTMRLSFLSIALGALGFIAYVLGEVFASLFSFGNAPPPVGQVIGQEISPFNLDYGNALIIFLSIFSLVFLVGILLRINPPLSRAKRSSNGTGYLGGVWTAAVTTLSATLCCGPLPAVIAVTTAIPSIYFTDLISYQSLLVLVSVPLLLCAIFLANKRAMKGCKLRYVN